jgi:hypothetical protein
MPAAQNIPSNRHKGPRHAYFNKTKFQPYRHCTERKPDDSWYRAMSSLCCPRCTKKLQWKIDYAKYLPQERARKCNLCQQKNVSIAYHRICQDCSRRHIRCAKCQMDPTTANQTDFWQKQRDDDEEEDGENDEQPVAKPAVAVVVAVERPVREARDGGGDDESDEEEVADPAAGTSDVQPARRNAGFDDADDDDEELKSLKGLDVGLLRAQKRRIRAMEEAAERAEMRERERRTVVRQEIAAAGGGRGGARDNGLDSDEEEM